MKKVIIIGATGQLGSELSQLTPVDQAIDLVSGDSQSMDITSDHGINAIRDQRPDLVINASAYTKVDLAETEADKAFSINHRAVQQLASTCRDISARLIHVSTDFVFDGSRPRPYAPDDKPNPLSVYGSSKLQGEQAIQSIKKLDFAIIRTAWVYSRHGQNFVKTMLRLMRERPELGVVYDQTGGPTWARNLAELIWQIGFDAGIQGVHHYTDAGVTSWYDFAVAIQEEALDLGLLDKPCNIRPILTAAYPTPATRPHYSVLDCQTLEHALQIQRPHWRTSLRHMLKEL